MKKSFLLQLIIAILLPTIGSLIISWIAISQYERSVSHLANGYIVNVAQVVAKELENPAEETEFSKHGEIKLKKIVQEVAQNFFYHTSFNKAHGLLTVLNSQKEKVFSTGKIDLTQITEIKEIKFNHASTITLNDGQVYIYAASQLKKNDRIVIFAVDMKEIHRITKGISIYIWPLVVSLLAIIEIFAIFFMWRKVIHPLQILEEDIAGLKWGEELPHIRLDNDPTDEIKKIRKTIDLLATSAVDHVQLTNSYVTDLLCIQEEERAHIAREIHDGPLQEITALIQRLRLISVAKNQEEASFRLKQAEEVSMESIREMRRLCDNLTPPWLELGLKHSLTELTERRSSQHNIKIFTDLDEVKELSTEQVLAFFRVTQEAISNAILHGDATEIHISLSNMKKKIVLEIADNGKGFNITADYRRIRLTGHRGLSNMYERMKLIGGNFSITSDENGTKIICSLGKYDV